MHSDARIAPVLAALAAPCARFRTNIEAARDQLSAYVTLHRAQSDGRARLVRTELGDFAAGRIDSARFDSVFGRSGALGTEAAAAIDACIAVLDELLQCGDALYTCNVPTGGDFGAHVGAALARTGRVFGAVLGFQAAKAGTFRAGLHGAQLDAFPFSRWNRAERLLAPPLAIEVDGADLDGGALAAYLDGGVKLVVIVRGASAPAPLARLITPGTTVLQGDETLDLAPLVGAAGPAVAALLPADAARFVHVPREGSTLRERLGIVSVPANAPRHRLGTQSAWQQGEELRMLIELVRAAEPEAATVPDAATVLALAATASAPGAETAAPAPAPTALPMATAPPVSAPTDERAVESLAAWLLDAAGLADRPAGGVPS